MKLSILYYSKTGRTRDTALAIQRGAEKIEGMEAKAFPLDEIDEDFLKESRVVVFGTPTYLANTCWQIKKWFDESPKYKLEGKGGAAYATADYVQGGADTAIMNIVGHMLVKGMMVYSGGSALGQPYLHLGAVIVKDRMETGLSQAEIFVEGIAKKAAGLFSEGVD